MEAGWPSLQLRIGGTLLTECNGLHDAVEIRGLCAAVEGNGL